MSITVENPIIGMWELRGKTVDKFGRDNTGLISYQINRQGFRSDQDFNFVPDYVFFGSSLVMGIGVPVQQTFAAQFANSQNYGVCGTYSNKKIFDIIQLYLASNCYSSHTKKVVVWTDRESDDLERYYQELKPLEFFHFFCGTQLEHTHCFKFLPNLDLDVSQTHMGVKTHQVFYKILVQLFK